MNLSDPIVNSISKESQYISSKRDKAKNYFSRWEDSFENYLVQPKQYEKSSKVFCISEIPQLHPVSKYRSLHPTPKRLPKNIQSDLIDSSIISVLLQAKRESKYLKISQITKKNREKLDKLKLPRRVSFLSLNPQLSIQHIDPLIKDLIN